MTIQRPVPGLAALDEGTVSDALERGRLVHLPHAWTPIRAQEPADEAWLILEGRADVVLDGRTVADLGPGDVAGEMGLVDHRLRSARVTITEPVLALAWPGRDFEALQRAHPDFDAFVRRTAAARREENEQA